MTLIICLDEQHGMAFGSRRQTRDSAVISDIFRTADGARLLVGEYSLPLLSQYGEVSLCPSRMRDILPEDFVFIEIESPCELLRSADRLIIYRWQRVYPADLKFEIPPESLGFTLTERREFAGSSHDKIIREEYRK